MVCAICGSRCTEGAHVRGKHLFRPGENHRRWNIIDLCPLCHTEFDNGNVAICSNKQAFLILEGDIKIKRIDCKQNINHLKNEFIQWKNEQCNFRLRLALGLIPGYEHYSKINGGCID